MATTYTGDDSTGLIVAASLPDDDDDLDVVSVNIAFEAIFDSLASLASGSVSFVGTHNYTSGATLAVSGGSSILLSGSSLLQIGSGCGLALANGSALSAVNSDWTMDAASTFAISGAVTFTATGTLDFLSGSVANIHGGADLHVLTGGGFHIDVGGFLQIDGQANINATGAMTVLPGGLLEAGGLIRINSGGGELRVAGVANYQSGALLNLNAGSQQVVTDASIAFLGSSVLAFSDTSVQGRCLREGATVQSGNNAWVGERLPLYIAPTSQTIDAWKVDQVFFNAPAAGNFTLTIADMPAGGDHHRFIISYFNGAGTGTGANVITLVDSMGTTIALIRGNTWALKWIGLLYTPAATPRWTFRTGAEVS